MDIGGHISGILMSVVTLLWTLLLIGSFSTVWITMVVLIYKTRSLFSQTGGTYFEKMARYNSISFEEMRDEKYKRMWKIVMISGTIFIYSLLGGFLVLFIAKKMHS